MKNDLISNIYIITLLINHHYMENVVSSLGERPFCLQAPHWFADQLVYRPFRLHAYLFAHQLLLTLQVIQSEDHQVSVNLIFGVLIVRMEDNLVCQFIFDADWSGN